MGYIREIDIEATPQRVFRAWVESTETQRWLAPRALIEPRPGGAYELSWSNEPGANSTRGCRLAELLPDARLRFEWRGGGAFDELFQPPNEPTIIEVRVARSGAGTTVAVEQPETRTVPGWGAYDERMADVWEEALQSLKRYCEGSNQVAPIAGFAT